MNDLKQLAAITALNDMLQKGSVNICTIDTVATMLGVNCKGEAYSILRPLHCVDFARVPQQLKEAIPGLIKECLSVEPTYQFPTDESLEKARQVVASIVSEQQQDPPRGLVRRLFGGTP